MRWAVVGAGGMLGRDVLARLSGYGEVRALTRADLDITDPAAVVRALRDADVVINCAAWTAVDAAETHEAEAFAVNAVGAANLARAAGRSGVRLVHVSTDYVFDGQLADGSPAAPYDEEAPTCPATAYGRTKLAGEWAVRALHPSGALVVRTAWLYGAGGPSFVRTMARVARERGQAEVVADQQGQPTWSADVADRIVALVEREAPPGVYHATSGGQASWWELAQEVFALCGLDPDRVVPVPTSAMPRPAPRPAWSVLGHGAFERVGLTPIQDWRARLRAAWPQLVASWGPTGWGGCQRGRDEAGVSGAGS